MIASERASDTSSLLTLPESLRDQLYTVKNSRRWQASNDDYGWPCDSSASTVELLSSTIFSKIFANGIHWEPHAGALEEVFASSTEPIRILDLGSGVTASWCVAMAERFPEAEVIGVDLIPSDLVYLPPNLTIEVHDLLEGLPYPEDFFDLIHSRCESLAGFLLNPRLDFLSGIAAALKPGGIALFEEPHNFADPVSSRDPDYPLLDAIRQRVQVRANFVKATTGCATVGGGKHLMERVATHDAFRGSTQIRQFELPLGARSHGKVSVDRQLGSIVRDIYFFYQELQDAGANLDEATIREFGRLDRAAVPEADVGLFFLLDVIWAQKSR